MKRSYDNLLGQFVPILVFVLTFLGMSSVGLYAQPPVIKGVVSASNVKVRYAFVTFINTNDTTKRVSALTDTSGYYSLSLPTSVELADNHPSEFEISQNYPNPFAASTAISYQLKTQADVQVTIYDILGREIKKFTMGYQSAGLHGIVWDGRNNEGKIVAQGIYFYQLHVKDETRIKKMIYGFGGNTNVMISPANILTAKVAEVKKESNLKLLGGNYTVRIENTDSTFPAIVAQQFENTTVQNNATLDFTVNSVVPYPNNNTAIIYFESPQQVIRGFGGANILQWRPDMTANQVNKAFGSGPGQIGMTILRLRVPYNNTESDLSIQIPTAKLAQSLGAIVFASPWTPPPSMKTNNNIVGGSLKDTSYAAYAAYLKTFADYMSSKGAPLYAISLQNEPDASVTYESCSWTAAQFLKFMKNNASAIGTKIMMPESQNFVHALSDPTLNDSAAAANVSIIAGHLYGGGLTSYPLTVSKGKEFWMTEYLSLDTTWAGVLATGKQINDCMTVGMNAYVWWYIVRFYGPIDENGNVTKRGYVMSQYSRFVRPGFTRVNATDNNIYTSVDVTAFRNGSKKVIVAINRRTTAKSHIFNLWNGTVGTFTPYVTSSTKNCEQQSDISYKNGSFTYTLDPLSITTFVSK